MFIIPHDQTLNQISTRNHHLVELRNPCSSLKDYIFEKNSKECTEHSRPKYKILTTNYEQI